MSVERILENFGVKLKKDVQKSYADKQKAKASKYGRTWNENSNLYNSVKFEIYETDSSVVFELKMDDYWGAIDDKRKPTEKGSKPGKLKPKIEYWIRKNNINPKEELKKIALRSNSNTVSRPLFFKPIARRSQTPATKPIDNMTYKEALTSLAVIYTRGIHKKGFQGTGFYSEVIKDGRLDLLKTQLQEEIKKDIIIEFNGSNT